jgi:hypothetical protein
LERIKIPISSRSKAQALRRYDDAQRDALKSFDPGQFCNGLHGEIRRSAWEWIGLRENFNRKTPYLMGKSEWFPVKIFPTKPIH